MAGTKVEVGKVAKPKEKAAVNTSNTEATQQQPTSQVVDEAKNESEAKSPVTDQPVTTEGQVVQSPSLDQQSDTKGNSQEDDKSVSVAKSEEKDVAAEKMTSELMDEPTPKVTEDAKDKLLWADDTPFNEADYQELVKPLISDKSIFDVNEQAKQSQTQDKQPKKNPFELRIKNNGRRRLLQFCGVFLEAGQTTVVTLKNQPEVDHVKDTLRQFNELAGRDDLIVEEAE